MKIGLHKEFGKGSIGGAEYSMVVLAEALSQRHDVEIVHHQAALTKEQLTQLFNADLERVTLRYVVPQPRTAVRSLNPWRKYRAARARYAELSQSVDLFVSFTHGEEPPPYCHAPVGMLVVLFPLSQRPRYWPYEYKARAGAAYVKERWGRLYRDWEWSRRLCSYPVRAAISQFTRVWTQRLWGIDCQVFYPPVEVDFQRAEKANTILSVGRYCSLKKQDELAAAFRLMEDLHRRGWQFLCAGGIGAAAEQAYYDKVRQHGDECPMQAVANVGRHELKTRYEQAKVFWHAAGFGEDEETNPGQSEHFGIVTVEAMAAGCVPVVIRKGGQPEIVQHGVNGFLWDTLEELRHYTLLLANDEPLRARMAEAARARAQDFRKEKFVRRFAELVSPHLPQPLPL